MKHISKILTLGLVLGFSAAAFANGEITQVLSDKTTQVQVDLNPLTVKMSSAGYERPYLKVLVPELATVTVLDHRNIGEDAPCVRLDDGQKATVDSMLAAGNGIETIAVHVVTKVTKTPYTINDKNGRPVSRCYVAMSETIDTLIRGKTFVHERFTVLPERNIADCK